MRMKIYQPLHLVPACLLSALAFCATELRAPAAISTSDGPALGYIGTYTGPKSKGIYSFRLDSSGTMTTPVLAAETVNPTFLAIHPNQQFLYAANETGNF